MSTTTNTDINYQGGPTGGKGGRTGDRSNRGADEEEGRDSERDKGNHADAEASKRGRAVTRLQAMPNGEYPIRNASELRAVVKEWQSGLKTTRYSGYEIQRHIIHRARDLKMVALLPSEWGVNLEIMSDAIKRAKAKSSTMVPTSTNEDESLMAEDFQSFLLAEGKIVPYPVILQEASSENNQTMRVKVPFYIGDSITNAPGFSQKILFPTAILQEIVQEGKQQIAAKGQPLTVYARHAHANDASYLPIGGVSDLMAEGSVGYAVIDIEPTTYGKDVQVLLRANPPKLNAVSLRSGKGKFEMENVEVKGERMLRVKKLGIAGIDFAPDSPAMKNYGFEVLQENVEVKAITNNKEEKTNNVDKLTLEMVKAQPEIVSEIEKPLVDRIDAEIRKNGELSKQNVELQAEVSKYQVSDYAREIAAKHPKPEEALPILLEIAKSCKSKDEFAQKTFPVLMEALSNKPKGESKKEETAEEKLFKLFGGQTPAGNGVVRTDTAEEITQEDELKGEHVGPLEVPS